ncbi:DUF7064 domain-containing protein [Nocardioides sp. YJ-D4]
MITPEDADFHKSDPSLTRWAESIGFWFAIPEERIYGNVYVLARPHVGATISSINVVQGINPDPFTADFTDPHMHTPCPTSMVKFDLANGLSVDVYEPPNNYRFVYESLNGACRFDLDFKGCMPAWDPNDPAENPLLAVSADHQDLGLGDAWAGGHLDFVGRVTGVLTLRGKTYEINSMGGFDRSWGTRTELGESALTYLHIPFDENFGVHLVTGLGIDDDKVSCSPLRFGYVYDHGETFGITEASMEAEHVNLLPASNRISVTDERGHTHAFVGSAVAATPWYSFSPSYLTNQALMRYEHDGAVGYGLMADVWGIEFLAARRSRHGRMANRFFDGGVRA